MVCEGLDAWSKRFDEQSAGDKKSMLLNIIDKIVITGSRVQVIYKIKMQPTGGDFTSSSVGFFYYQDLVKGSTVAGRKTAQKNFISNAKKFHFNLLLSASFKACSTVFVPARTCLSESPYA